MQLGGRGVRGGVLYQISMEATVATPLAFRSTLWWNKRKIIAVQEQCSSKLLVKMERKRRKQRMQILSYVYIRDMNFCGGLRCAMATVLKWFKKKVIHKNHRNIQKHTVWMEVCVYAQIHTQYIYKMRINSVWNDNLNIIKCYTTLQWALFWKMGTGSGISLVFPGKKGSVGKAGPLLATLLLDLAAFQTQKWQN